MIPKCIHYCWFGGNELPRNVQMNIKSWHKYCPDYEIIEWNENNFNIKENSYCWEAYKAKKWAFVSDYVRIYVLYNYGGIYLDTDVEMIRNMDIFLKYDSFWGIEGENEVGTGIIGSAAKKNVIKKILSSYENSRFIKENGKCDFTTNVERITKILKSYYDVDISNRIIEIDEGNVIFPHDFFSAKSLRTGKVEKTDRTYTIHHYNASWMEQDDKEQLEATKNYYNKLSNLKIMHIPNVIKYTLAKILAAYSRGGFDEIKKRVVARIKK